MPNPTDQDLKWWRPLRRRVRVEAILRGSYPQKEIDVYEMFWTDGTSGDWNSTQNNERDLFLVRRENGRWHIVRDWWRSIYAVLTGYHARLPLDATRPFWERYALMSYWISADQAGPKALLSPRWPSDPDRAIGDWRRVKLLRGLLRHPQPRVRAAGCWALPSDQDECVDRFSEADWKNAGGEGLSPRSPQRWDANRERIVRDNFDWEIAQSRSSSSMDQLRLFTTINHPTLRREFCRKFMAKFPNDTDNGCPADKPPPATIVTENGDVPLVGNWPAPQP